MLQMDAKYAIHFMEMLTVAQKQVHKKPETESTHEVLAYLVASFQTSVLPAKQTTSGMGLNKPALGLIKAMFSLT